MLILYIFLLLCGTVSAQQTVEWNDLQPLTDDAHRTVYFKFIFSVSIRILIEIFVFKLNKFSTLSSQYITYSIYYGCFPGIIFTNQHIYAFLKMNF